VRIKHVVSSLDREHPALEYLEKGSLLTIWNLCVSFTYTVHWHCQIAEVRGMNAFNNASNN